MTNTKTLHDREVDAYYFDSIYIQPEALQEEFARVSMDFAYWSAQATDAYEAQQMAELDVKRAKARLYVVNRTTLEMESPNGKTTEAQVEAAVVNDPEMVAAEITRIQADVARDRAKLTLEAIRIKKDMLVSLGAHERTEMQGDPTIRAYHANRTKARLAGEDG